MYFLLAILCFLVLIPLSIMVMTSLSNDPFKFEGLSIATYVEFFSSPRYVSSLANSLVVGFLTTLIAIAIGVPLAWLMARTDMPYKGFIKYIVVIPYIVPPYIYAMAWILVASPNIGLFNTFLNNIAGVRPFNIYSFEGMAWVLGLYTMPFVFMTVYSAITLIDYSLEEQSYISGAGPFRTFTSVTLRLMMPALISSAILVYILSIELFTIPLLIGVPSRLYTLPAVIFIDLYASTPPKYALGAISSVILLAITFVLMYLYFKAVGYEKKYATIAGRGFKVGVISLGRYRYVIGIAVIAFIALTIFIPIAVLFIHSLSRYWAGNIDPSLFTLDNYVTVLSDSYFIDALKNTIIVGIIAIPLITFASLVISYIASRAKYLGRKALDVVAMVPYTIPGYIFSLALLIAWSAYIPIGVVGTLAALWLAVFIRYLPFAVRINSPAIMAVSPELEEASVISGASWIRTFTRVLLPLLKNSISLSMVISYIYSIRDVGAVLFLVTGSTMVVPVQILFYWFNGSWNYASAASIIQIALILPAAIFLIKNIGVLAGGQR